MKIRDVLILIAMLIGSVTVISFITGEEETQPQITDTTGSAEPQPLLAEKRANQILDSRVAKPATADPTPPENVPHAKPARKIGGGKRQNEPPGERFNELVLVDLGYPPETIHFIRTFWEQAAEEKEERANRSDNDWVIKEPLATDINDALRSDLGDDLYDAMLYATNQPNRAKIGNVIGSSPAAAAGLRIKDVVVSYDGERVFDSDEMKRLSKSSDPDRTVEIWILRDGKNINMHIKGGPLGVRYFPDWKTPILD